MSEQTSFVPWLMAAAAVGLVLGRPGAAPSPQRETTTPATASAPRDLAALLKHTRAEVIIATAPDPRQGPYGSAFDTLLGALQRAASHQHYLLEHFRIRSDEGLDYLWFGAQSSSVAVVLIPETPAGVDERALLEALTLIEEHQPQSSVRVLGPSFSGAARSLSQLLLKHVPPQRIIRVVSGTATSPQVPLLFADRRFDFSSATISDDLLLVPFLEYLHAHATRRKSAPIALLVEANTGYGQALQGLARHFKGKLIVVPFPQHVAALRNASPTSGAPVPSLFEQLPLQPESQPIADLPPLSAPGLSVPQMDLLLDATLEGLARDRVELVGVFATSLVDKVFLMRRVRRHLPDVRFFTLESDLLLTRLDLVEDVRGLLVASPHPLFDARHLLGEHQDAELRYDFRSTHEHGFYLAMTLLLGGQPKPGVAILSLDAQRAAFWVTELQHGRFWPRSMRQVHARLFDATPPVESWSGPEQLSVERAQMAKFAQAALPLAQDNPSRLLSRFVVPRGYLLLFVGLSLLLLFAHVFPANQALSAKAGPAQPGPSRRSSWLIERYPNPFRPSALLILYLRMGILGGGFAFFFVPMALPPLVSLGPGELLAGIDWLDRIGLGGVLALGAFTLAGTTFVAVRAVGRLASEDFGRGVPSQKAAWAYWLGLGLFFVLVHLPAANWAYRGLGGAEFGYANTYFLFERAIHLGSGPSPLTVVLALSFTLYVGTATWFRQHNFLSQRPTELRVSVWLPLLPERQARHIDGLLAALAPPGLTELLVVLVPLSLYALTVWERFLPTLEGRGVDLTFFGIITIIVALFVLTAERLVRIWWHTSGILTPLEQHPLLQAFSRISSRRPHNWSMTLFPYGPSDEAYLLGTAQHQKLLAAAPANLAEQLGISPSSATILGEGTWAQLRTLVATLNPLWGQDPTRRWYVSAEESWSTKLCEGQPLDQQGWLLAAEEAVAYHLGLFVQEIYFLLFNKLTFITSAAVIMIGCFILYPFPARGILLGTAWALTLVVVTAVATILLQMDRQAIVRRLVGAQSEHLNWSLVLVRRLGAHVAIPLALLFLAQFPGLRAPLTQLLTQLSALLPLVQ